MMHTRLALRAGPPIARGLVLVLIVGSMTEVLKTLIGIIRDLENNNEILLIGALAAALVPSMAMLLWACRAIVVDLDLFRKHIEI